MSKKTDSMSPQDRAKKYGNEIMGVGIFYLVIYILCILLLFNTFVSSPLSLLFAVLQIAMLIFMIIGGSRKNNLGVKAALVFEIYMIITSVLSIILFGKGPDLIGLLVMICLPFDIKGLSKAIKEIENQDNYQSNYSTDVSNDNNYIPNQNVENNVNTYSNNEYNNTNINNNDTYNY